MTETHKSRIELMAEFDEISHTGGQLTIRKDNGDREVLETNGR